MSNESGNYVQMSNQNEILLFQSHLQSLAEHQSVHVTCSHQDVVPFVIDLTKNLRHVTAVDDAH
jgi:hypothetical protein